MTGTRAPHFIAPDDSTAVHGTPPEVDVGEILRRMDVGRAMSSSELEQHIADCTVLWQRAYARFQAHDNPADRDEAVLWLHRMNEAILMRPGMERLLPWRQAEGAR